MKTVITSEQAEKVTKKRAPQVPVEYEDACKSLAACIDIDEAKYWSDKADALAAWAKIYHSNDAERKSKQLKLHAFRRMGQLAKELRPQIALGGAQRADGAFVGGGSTPGPRSLLLEKGLSAAKVAAAIGLAHLPKDRFEQMVNRPRPPSLNGAIFEQRTNPEWAEVARAMSTCRSFLKRHDPQKITDSLTKKEAAAALELIVGLTEWLDEFDLHLRREGRTWRSESARAKGSGAIARGYYGR